MWGFGWVKNARNSFRAWRGDAKKFGDGIWGSFKGNLDGIGSAKIERREIPFNEALRMWGIAPHRFAVDRARRVVACMCIFFWLIFFWCAFYFVRSAVFQYNFMAALASFIGMCTGFLVGIINLWRWQVLAKKIYVPFLKWLGRGGSV